MTRNNNEVFLLKYHVPYALLNNTEYVFTKKYVYFKNSKAYVCHYLTTTKSAFLIAISMYVLCFIVKYHVI